VGKSGLVTVVKSRKNTFLKLNVLSVISGLFLFIVIQSGLNIHRVERLTELGFNTLENIYIIFYIIGFLFLTGVLIFLTRKWMVGRLSRFWLTILWFPYFLIFNYIWISLFPLTYRGDIPSTGTGFIVILGMVFYPFYLLIINLIS